MQHISYPNPLNYFNNVAKLMLLGLMTVVLCLVCCSCRSIKDTIPVETIREVTKTDTVYLNKLEYDSIYIDRFAQVQKVQGVQEVQGVRVDTLVKELTKYEYKYKLLRDTVFKTKIEHVRDSIPYQVTVTKVEQVRYVPPWVKYLAIAGAMAILLVSILIYTKLTNR